MTFDSDTFRYMIVIFGSLTVYAVIIFLRDEMKHGPD